MSALKMIVFLAMFAASLMVTLARNCENIEKCPEDDRETLMEVLLQCFKKQQSMVGKNQPGSAEVEELEKIMTQCLLNGLIELQCVQDVKGCPGCESDDIQQWTCKALENHSQQCLAEMMEDLAEMGSQK
ncbi:hypothetical protein CHUAL_010737 [Chamberlinius hualienensis]